MTTGPEPKPESTRETNSDALQPQDTAERPESPLDHLHGLMREEFAEHGGGEAFLKRLRTDPEEMGTTMEIRYTLTIPEFKEAYGVVMRRASARYRFDYWVYTWLGATIGLLLLGLAVLLFGTKDPNQPLVFLFVVIGLINLVTPLRYRGMVRRHYRMQNLDLEIVLSLGSEGVTVRRPSRDITTHYGWSAFERQIESRRLFTLCPARIQFVPVPKRAMTSEQQVEFRALSAAHISGTNARTAAVRQG